MYPYSHLPKPLRPAEFYILLALAGSPLHGYALKAAIMNNSLGSVVVPDSKLYSIITKLHDEGLIDTVGQKPAGKSGTPRMHYDISDYGKIRLQEESTRLDHAVKTAKLVGALDNQVPTDLQRMLKSLS